MKKTLANFQPLKPAEEKLLECCQNGELALIGEERPTGKTGENEIRAAFIRWLVLTNEVEIDPIGIQLEGALISGILNFDNILCERILFFKSCCIEEVFYLRHAKIKTIYLPDSLCEKGINGDGLICNGDLFLRNGFEACAEVRFVGAQIDGDFNCNQAVFKTNSKKQKALSCDKAIVKGTVSLFDSRIEGEVRFLGAQIEGDFDCEEVVFKANSEEHIALSCDGMNVFGRLFLRENCTILVGYMDLTSASVGALVDDESFWKQKTLLNIELNGFKYGHIYGSVSAPFRLEKMLGKMSEFSPQPYKQLAKVLREMGHDRDADEVMIALHDKKLEVSQELKCYKAFRKLYKWTSAYGYRPMRTLTIMASVWFLFGCIYWYGANVAVFAPTNPLIFQNKEYNCSVNVDGTTWSKALPKYYNASNNWYIASPAEYTTFQPFWYSLDIILPVVDLKMENDWGIVIPSPEGNWSDMIPFTTTNHFIRFLTWVETLAGWGLSLMLAAILSGLAKNEKE